LDVNVRHWLQFLRVPNALTAAADVLAGALAVGVPWGPELLLQALGSAFLYAGGIALNDVMDAPRDAIEHPQRAIPAGRISRGAALRTAIILFCAGILPLALCPQRLAVVMVVVAGIVLYDILPERFPWMQALTLGVVRGCNLLSGALIAVHPVDERIHATAAGYGLLVLVLTLASQREGTGKSVRMHGRLLFFACLVPYGLWVGKNPTDLQIWQLAASLALAAIPMFTAWRRDSSPAELVGVTLRLLIPWMALLLWCSGHGSDALIVLSCAGMQWLLARKLKTAASD
jgi:heme O synthase-like polyprenyltransferase